MKSEHLTTLLSLVKQVPALMAAAIDGKTNVTLFAPINKASFCGRRLPHLQLIYHSTVDSILITTVGSKGFEAILPKITAAGVNVSDPKTLAMVCYYRLRSPSRV